MINKGNPDGSFCDLDEVLERIPWETSKESLQFSVRALIKKDLVMKQGLEKRRSRSRRLLSLTEKGFRWMRAISGPG